MNAFDDDAMRYEKRSMVNDYLDQMKGTGFEKDIQNRIKNDNNGRPFNLKTSTLKIFKIFGPYQILDQ